jgi:hypothetical protein
MHIQCGDVGPCAATEVLVFDVHRRPWSAVLRGMLTATRLDTRLFVGGNNKLIFLQCTALPLASVQVQNSAGLASEVRITWKDPTAVIPVIAAPNGIFV